MNSEEVKEYVVDFQKKELPPMIKRELKVPDTSKIITIIGPRRTGKTFFLMQKMLNLLEAGVKKNSILYLNFEDPRLTGISFKEMREIIKIHWQAYPESIKERLHLFVDEPQNIENWETAVRSLHDEGFHIFLSGSSSRLLSSEIATSLRGRTLTYTLLPFSFREFLKMKSSAPETERLGSKEKAALRSQLDEYLEFGGFPEVIKEKERETKIKIISEYLDLIVYKDLVERYHIKNTQIIKWLIKSLIASFSKELSVHKIYLTLKSQGIKLSKNTLYTYASMLQDVLFLWLLTPFNRSIRKKDFSINKAYLADNGFSNLAEHSKNKGRKMENATFLELKRRQKSTEAISYWKTPQGDEVDFVLLEKTKAKQLIQVCCELSEPDIKEREARALIKASKELKCKNLLIITDEKEGEEELAWFGTKRKIIFKPLWKWLLE